METVEETGFNGFISRLQSSTDDPAMSTSYVENYLKTYAGRFPIVEGNTVHFICKERPGVVTGIGAEWNGWDPRKALMTSIGGGLLHYQHEFEEDARLDYLFYKISPDNLHDLLSDPRAIKRMSIPSMRDPLNHRIGESGFGPRSELAMPAYQRPVATHPQAGTPNGTLHESIIESKTLEEERTYIVYLPHGYNTTGEAYPSIYFKDGGDYLTMGRAPTILDNLISAGAIPPVVAVFIPPVDRDAEYNCGDAYVSFLCDELIPDLHQQIHLSTNPAKRAVLGPSLGGLISLYIGSQRPDMFGLIGAQSTAIRSTYGLDKFDSRIAYAMNPPLPLRLYLVIGTYEDCFLTDSQGRCWDLLNPVRELRAVLEHCGYAYRYSEQHQGHSWGMWRDTLPDALLYFFGKP